MEQVIRWVLYFSLASGNPDAVQPVNYMGDILIASNENKLRIPYTGHYLSGSDYNIVKQITTNDVSYFYCESKRSKNTILIVSVYDDYIIACDPFHRVTYESYGFLNKAKDVSVFYRNKDAISKLSKEQAIKAGAESARVFGWQ